ncbi:MAG: hypothetical protein M3451_12065, partial [Chloroflexota bacterium]|nr:hypothetical protein [Chloroflexota bacterium]
PSRKHDSLRTIDSLNESLHISIHANPGTDAILPSKRGFSHSLDPKGPVATVRYWASWSLANGARPKVGFLLTFDYRCMVGARSIERI